MIAVGDRDPSRDQPLPRPGAQDVQQALINAIAERRAYGITKYGQPLETLNGRDALRDAWEEVIDLAAYLTQLRLERGDSLSGPSGKPASTCLVCQHPWHGDRRNSVCGQFVDQGRRLICHCVRCDQ